MEADDFPRIAIPFGWIAAWGAAWRRRTRAGRGTRVALPVISVGNLTVGGTGKTPVVRAVARWLEEAGARPAILSRGYARPMPQPGVTRISHRGRIDVLRWEMAGDEPWMLARTLRKSSVYVSADRVPAAFAAEADGAGILVLDDGFQHLGLRRDLDIVCLRGDEAGLRVLPAGPLRESASALKDAGAAVWIRAPLAPDEGDDPAKEASRLRGRLAPGAIWAVAGLEPERITLPDGTDAAPGQLKGRAVGVLCGIARPLRFAATLQGLGARIEAFHTRGDHHVFTPRELEMLREDLLWVTTEKDAARLPASYPVAVVRSRLLFSEGEDELKRKVLDLAADVPAAEEP